jgi:tetratricopeptide (TPR) repeat protein
MMPTIRMALWAGLCCLGAIISESVWAQSCEPWTARVISVQGSVRIQRSVSAGALAAKLDDLLCVGDQVLVDAFSRAALVLRDETVVRLDANTRVTLQPPQDQKTSWPEVLKGLIHIVSRDPRALTVVTPFANAGIEGTEFLIEVTSAQASVTVFEGKVAVSSATGAATAVSGEQVIATPARIASQPVTVRPPNAVVWALFYPPVLGGASLPAADAAAPSGADAQFFTGRAARRLAVGRVAEARADLDQSLQVSPDNAEALALQAMIALTQNDRDRAIELATRARDRDPASAAALLAYSYTQQARFDITGALETLQTAAEKNPADALVRARLSEMWLAVGDLDRSVAAAEQAVALDADVALSQSVLGFAYLARIDTAQAKSAFGKAIALDSAAPLPRLGLGLALIREGELAAGRAEIENAVILDPGSAVIRSYVGKAYYEEKRDKLAESQLGIAQELDALDPTPWFYDAIRKQSVNQPVDALRDNQAAIDRNDNRAVYRSRLLVDADLAARSAALGQIYNDLGFEQLALLEGYESVAADPANYSGHRLLADTYDSHPRHEIARVNELFRSQLLQPNNITPVPARLGQASLFLSTVAGPSGVSYNEFNPLFNRNDLRVQASGVSGGNDTWGDDVTVAGIWNRLSFSLGQYHFETDGFRENNDSEQDVLNAFAQYEFSPDTSALVELRSTNTDEGDLSLLFDSSFYTSTLRQKEDTDSARFGVRHDFTPRSQVLASFLYQDADIDTTVNEDIQSDDELDGYTSELQHIWRGGRWDLTSGLRYITYDHEQVVTGPVFIPVPPFVVIETIPRTFDVDDVTGYVYSHLELPAQVDVTLGVSASSTEGQVVDDDQVNPKMGITWRPFTGTTIRGAAFRTLQAATFSRSDIQPYIEPTEVAGFNQFFAGSEGEDVWRYGVGIDQQITERVAAGAEWSRRDIETPVAAFETEDINKIKTDEFNGRAYLYWTPLWNVDLALRGEYQYDKQEADGTDFIVGTNNTEIRAHRVPLSLRYFAPSGIGLGLTGTYVDQKGDFLEFLPFPPFVNQITDDDDFWVVDASVSYRLPKRYGLISLTVNNLFDEDFKFQDIDPRNPRLLPERVAFLKFTLDFSL